MGKCSPLSSTQVSFPSSITPGSFGLMLSSPQLFAPSNTVETSFFLVLLFPHVKAKLIVFFVSYDFLLCLCVEFSPLCTLSWSSQTFFFQFFSSPRPSSAFCLLPQPVCTRNHSELFRWSICSFRGFCQLYSVASGNEAKLNNVFSIISPPMKMPRKK